MKYKKSQKNDLKARKILFVILSVFHDIEEKNNNKHLTFVIKAQIKVYFVLK
jgi:hypothetical protein